ncbi:MAG: capsule assembly Wzi family protein [Nitrospirota bacterium]
MRVAAVAIALLAVHPVFAAEPHLPIHDPVYRGLERLAALGVINEALLKTKPLSRGALGSIVREIRANAETGSDPWIAADVRAIERRLASLGSVTDVVLDGRVVVGEGPPVPTGIERLGDRFNDGGNVRAGVELGGSLGPWAAWGYHPEIRYPVGATDDLDFATRAAYLSIAGAGLALTVGREAMWWGPGFRGSLLLTDYARPFDLVRLEPSRPWRLKWIGATSVHLFVTRLEADRAAIPKPYLAGLRLAFRPHRLLEVGLARTAMFGGEGRPLTADLLWDVIRARGENDQRNPGNQLAGADVTVRIPWRRQPLEFYAEWGGEDHAKWLPSHPAVVAGVYLPKLFGSSRWELRGEYADNAFANVAGVWYQHAVYRSGYTYHGFVIGHPMGTDARMLSLEIERRFTPEWALGALYDGVQSGVFGPGETSGRSAGARLSYDAPTASGQLEYRYTRIEQPGEPSGDDGHVVTASIRTLW